MSDSNSMSGQSHEIEIEVDLYKKSYDGEGRVYSYRNFDYENGLAYIETTTKRYKDVDINFDNTYVFKVIDERKFFLAKIKYGF